MALPARAGRHAGLATTPRTARWRSGTSRSCARPAPATSSSRARPSGGCNQYRDFFAHLDGHYRRVHSSQYAVVFELSAPARTAPGPASDEDRPSVLVVGSHDPESDRPPQDLVEELSAAQRFDVAQRWQPAPAFAPGGTTRVDEDADWLSVRRRRGDAAARVRRLVPRGCELAGAARRGARAARSWSGPEAGPPATERLLGVHARELESVTPIPVLAVRRGAPPEGPTAILDSVPIRLRKPVEPDPRALPAGDVGDVFLGDAGSPRRAVYRSQWSPKPKISVLISTYDRPELLAACLTGFCAQTLPVGEFEVVVVDDGTPGPKTEAVLREFSAQLPLTWVRIEHAGRAAAKNLAVMLARGDLVLFFDDDDVPAVDMLDAHLEAHERHPDEHTAILGHTDWSPELEVDAAHALPHRGRRHALRLRTHRARQATRLALLLGGTGLVEARSPPAPRAPRSAPRLLHRRRDGRGAWRGTDWRCSTSPRPGARCCGRSVSRTSAAAARRRAERRRRSRDCTTNPSSGSTCGSMAPPNAGTRPRPSWTRSARASRSSRRSSRTTSRPTSAKAHELHRAYRAVFQADIAKGIIDGMAGDGVRRTPSTLAVTGIRLSAVRTSEGDSGEAPAITVTMPVWSREPGLAAMAVRAIERVWEVSRMPIEVVVVDNGSPEPHPGMRARVSPLRGEPGGRLGMEQGHRACARARDRRPQQRLLGRTGMGRGAARGCDHGAPDRASRTPTTATAAASASPTRRARRAGASCSRATSIDEVGPFDERFNPAYVEDTDYWHRAWELGIELAPVPAARVTHARRTSADKRSRLAADRPTATCTAGSTASSRCERRRTTTARSSSTTASARAPAAPEWKCDEVPGPTPDLRHRPEQDRNLFTDRRARRLELVTKESPEVDGAQTSTDEPRRGASAAQNLPRLHYWGGMERVGGLNPVIGERIIGEIDRYGPARDRDRGAGTPVSCSARSARRDHEYRPRCQSLRAHAGGGGGARDPGDRLRFCVSAGERTAEARADEERFDVGLIDGSHNWPSVFVDYSATST